MSFNCLQQPCRPALAPLTPKPLALARLSLILALAALLASSGTLMAQNSEVAVPAPSVTPLDSIVALVDEDVIMRSELDLALEGILERIRASGEAMPPQDLIENQVLERLIIRELQVQKALQTGIRVSDADIDQAMVTLAQQNQITVQQMRQVIENDGEDFAEFRRNIGEELMTDRLRQRIVNGMQPITDTEVEIMLASQDGNGGEYNISHIMIAVAEGSTPQQIQMMEEQAKDVYAKLVGGLDFASAAISYSKSQEALEGGEVGWRDLNSIPAFFADAVRDLETGQFSKPIRSPAGFHILKVNDYREQRQVVVKEYNARHIMIEINELIGARAAMDQIIDIRERLNKGEDFAELAKEFSNDTTTANLGGDMGWFPPQAYGDRVEQTLLALQDDQISEPFQTMSGWHIVQLLGTRETDRTEEAIREEAREKIRQQKAELEIEKTLRQFRDEAFVEIRLPGAENSSG